MVSPGKACDIKTQGLEGENGGRSAWQAFLYIGDTFQGGGHNQALCSQFSQIYPLGPKTINNTRTQL